MKVKYRTFSGRSAATPDVDRHRPAMTLVEVVGALALLGTLLVATLLAKARYTRQAASADRRLQAVAAADEMLTGWRRDPQSLDRSGAGRVPGDVELSWRTQVVPDPVTKELGATVVRLEIFEDRAAAAASPLVTSVEFLVDPEPAPAGGPATRAVANPNSPRKNRQTTIGKPSEKKSLHHP
jgi:type II secretory pathway pseudopilin PulG